MRSIVKSLFLNIFTIGLLLACTSQVETVRDKLLTSLEGTWEWRKEDSTCQDNSHTLKFDDVKKSLIIKNKKETMSYDGKGYEVAEYKILKINSNSVSLALKSETRVDSSGSPVTWDLKLISTNEYCWRRSDWPDSACTPLNYRCN
jgi:hypothetical protein